MSGSDDPRRNKKHFADGTGGYCSAENYPDYEFTIFSTPKEVANHPLSIAAFLANPRNYQIGSQKEYLHDLMPGTTRIIKKIIAPMTQEQIKTMLEKLLADHKKTNSLITMWGGNFRLPFMFWGVILDALRKNSGFLTLTQKKLKKIPQTPESLSDLLEDIRIAAKIETQSKVEKSTKIERPVHRRRDGSAPNNPNGKTTRKRISASSAPAIRANRAHVRA